MSVTFVERPCHCFWPSSKSRLKAGKATFLTRPSPSNGFGPSRGGVESPLEDLHGVSKRNPTRTRGATKRDLRYRGFEFSG